MPETTIKFTTDAKGAITGTEQLGKSLGNLDKTASQASKGGLKGFTTGLADMKAGFDVLTGSLSGVVSFTAELVNLGTASRQMKESFNTLSGGNVVNYLEQMRASTRGLIPDVDLLKSGTKAMVLGLAQSGDQLAVLAKAGTVLGRVMGIDAAQGMETLTVAMSRVNQTMLLDNIGLSATNVTNRFKVLKETMSEQDAWSAAVLEEAGRKVKLLEGNLDGAGAGVKRLEVAFDGLKTSAGENLSYLIDQTLILIGALDEYDKRRNKGSTSPTGTTPGLANGNISDTSWYTQTAIQMNALIKAQEDAVKYKYLYLDGAKMTGALLKGAFGMGSLFRSDTWTGATAGADYDKQYKDFFANQRDINVRRSYRDYAGTGRTMGRETMGSLYAKQATERFGIADEFNKSVQAANLLNQVVQGGKNLLSPYVAGVGQIAAAWQNAGEVAKRAQSKSAAFGTTGGGIFGEIGGDMGSLFDQRRETYKKELEKQYGANYKKLNEGIAALNKQYGGNTKDAGYQKGLRGLYGKYGANTTAINKGMESYDKDTKSAMDAYKLATGQATKASLAFDDQLASLQKKFLDGKIDAKTYAKELRDLGTAASLAGGDFDKLMVALGRSAEDASSGPKDQAGTGKKWGFYKPPRKGAYTGPQKVGYNTTREEPDADSPFASIQTGLATVDKGLKEITTNVQGMPDQFASAFSTAADKVQPMTKAVADLNSKVSAMLTQKSHVSITVIGYGGAAGNAGGGGGRPF